MSQGRFGSAFRAIRRRPHAAVALRGDLGGGAGPLVRPPRRPIPANDNPRARSAMLTWVMGAVLILGTLGLAIAIIV